MKIDDVNKTTESLINTILSTKNIFTIFKNNVTLLDEIKETLKIIHPDICKLSGAVESTQKLLQFKNELHNGKSYTDEIGTITYFSDHFEIIGDIKYLKKSLYNYNLIKKINDPLFNRYIPDTLILKNEKLIGTFFERSLPLNSIEILQQEHLNWLLNRLLEFITYLHLNGYSHNGLNLDNIFIDPKNHGIMVISFYHLNKLNTKLTSLSGKYSKWYNTEIFKNKMSLEYIDIEMSKRIIATIAGDTSGLGIKLKKTHNINWVNFLIEFCDNNSFEILTKYRQILEKNFEKRFYVLDI